VPGGAGRRAVGERRRVGFQLYADMLKAAVAAPVGPRAPTSPNPWGHDRDHTCTTGAAARQLLARRARGLSSTSARQRRSARELDAMAGGADDRFGPLPEPAQALVAAIGCGSFAPPAAVTKVDAGPERAPCTSARSPRSTPASDPASCNATGAPLRGPDRVHIRGAPRARRAGPLVREFLGRSPSRRRTICRGPRSADADVAHLLPPQGTCSSAMLSATTCCSGAPPGHVLVDTGYVRHVPLRRASRLVRGWGPNRSRRSSTALPQRPHGRQRGNRSRLRLRYRGARRRSARGQGWDGPGVAPRLRRPDRRAPSSGRGARPGERYVWGDLAWTRSPPPDHDWARCASTNEEHRVLISGDANVGARFGFVMPPGSTPRPLPATAPTLEGLAKLDVQVVIPGHASLCRLRARWGAPRRARPSRPTDGLARHRSR